MSWEYSKYEAICKRCGHPGFCIEGSDDWGRSGTWWEGFKGRPPSLTAVARKKASADHVSPVCDCGSSEIKVGKYLGDVKPFIKLADGSTPYGKPDEDGNSSSWVYVYRNA